MIPGWPDLTRPRLDGWHVCYFIGITHTNSSKSNLPTSRRRPIENDCVGNRKSCPLIGKQRPACGVKANGRTKSPPTTRCTLPHTRGRSHRSAVQVGYDPLHAVRGPASATFLYIARGSFPDVSDTRGSIRARTSPFLEKPRGPRRTWPVPWPRFSSTRRDYG